MTTINLKSIRYMDEPDRDYIRGVDDAKLRIDLWNHTAIYAPLFPDAHEQALAIEDDERFLQWRAGLRCERKGKFAGEDFMVHFGAILMPANMIHIGMVANQFKVPFGLAFCRMVETGMLDIKSGQAIIVERETT